jgi:hypothetical protein
MATITYGSGAGFSRSTSKSFEYVAPQDKDGDVADNILKYTRTETTTETVTSTFGAPELDGEDVISATLTWSVDEQIVDPSTAGAVPPHAYTYNPRCEASATILADTFTAATFELDGITFDTVSAELAETAGDVKKYNLRGVNYGEDGDLTIGDISGGGTIREEKRFSNTDFVREIETTVAFAAS